MAALHVGESAPGGLLDRRQRLVSGNAEQAQRLLLVGDACSARLDLELGPDVVVLDLWATSDGSHAWAIDRRAR